MTQHEIATMKAIAIEAGATEVPTVSGESKRQRNAREAREAKAFAEQVKAREAAEAAELAARINAGRAAFDDNEAPAIEAAPESTETGDNEASNEAAPPAVDAVATGMNATLAASADKRNTEANAVASWLTAASVVSATPRSKQVAARKRETTLAEFDLAILPAAQCVPASCDLLIDAVAYVCRRNDTGVYTDDAGCPVARDRVQVLASRRDGNGAVWALQHQPQARTHVFDSTLSGPVATDFVASVLVATCDRDTATYHLARILRAFGGLYADLPVVWYTDGVLCVASRVDIMAKAGLATWYRTTGARGLSPLPAAHIPAALASLNASNCILDARPLGITRAALVV